MAEARRAAPGDLLRCWQLGIAYVAAATDGSPPDILAGRNSQFVRPRLYARLRLWGELVAAASGVPFESGTLWHGGRDRSATARQRGRLGVPIFVVAGSARSYGGLSGISRRHGHLSHISENGLGLFKHFGRRAETGGSRERMPVSPARVGAHRRATDRPATTRRATHRRARTGSIRSSK